MNDKEKKAIILHDILIPSISMLYNEDFSNIRFGASERNISARLASSYGEYDAKNSTSLFKRYYADVE